MIVVCSKCNAEYNIRDDKIPEYGASARCKKCQNIIPVMHPNAGFSPAVPTKRVYRQPTPAGDQSTPPPGPHLVGGKSINERQFSTRPTKPQPAPPGFKDPTSLNNVLKVMLIASIVLAATAIVSSFAEYQLLVSAKNGVEIYESEVNSNDTRQMTISLFQILMVILTAVIFLKWVHRAGTNVRKLGATGMKFTPGWAVGYYFIPIFNLWKPYQAMKEIWQASKSPANWSNERESGILGCWWTFWIISGLVNRYSMKQSLKAEEIEELINATMTSILADGIYIALCIIAIMLTGKLSEMQMAKIWKPT